MTETLNDSNNFNINIFLEIASFHCSFILIRVFPLCVSLGDAGQSVRRKTIQVQIAICTVSDLRVKSSESPKARQSVGQHEGGWIGWRLPVSQYEPKDVKYCDVLCCTKNSN